MNTYSQFEEGKKTNIMLEFMLQNIYRCLPNLDKREKFYVYRDNEFYVFQIYEQYSALDEILTGKKEVFNCDEDKKAMLYRAEEFTCAGDKILLVLRLNNLGSQYGSEISEEQITQLMKSTKDFFYKLAENDNLNEVRNTNEDIKKFVNTYMDIEFGKVKESQDYQTELSDNVKHKRQRR